MTDYVIRAETTATALKGVGEIICDGLLSAMVMKGLPKVICSCYNTKRKSDDISKF